MKSPERKMLIKTVLINVNKINCNSQFSFVYS